MFNSWTAVKSVLLKIAGVAFFAVLLFGKYKLARAKVTGIAVLFLLALAFAASTGSKLDASEVPNR